MLQPARHGKNTVLLEELANLLFPGSCVLYPAIGIFRGLERRSVLVALFFVRFKRNRAIPFLLAHFQDLLRRIGAEGDVFKKEDVSIATEGRFFWRRRQPIIQVRVKMFERISRPIRCLTQLLFTEGCSGSQ